MIFHHSYDFLNDHNIDHFCQTYDYRVVGSMKNLKKLNPDVEIIPFSQHLELTDDFSFLQGYQVVKFIISLVIAMFCTFYHIWIFFPVCN